MATTNPTMPRPSRPQLGYGSWPAPNAPQMGYGTWPTLNAPPPYFDPGPIMAAPQPQPLVKAKRRVRTVVAWSLWMLAIGLAAGPLLVEYVDQGVEAGVEWLVKWAPNFAQPYLPKPLAAGTGQRQGSIGARGISAAPSATSRPASERPAPALAARPVEAKAPAAAEPSQAIQPERPVEHIRAHKTRATRRHAAASAESAAPRPATRHARHSRSEVQDPWARDEAAASQAAKPERPDKAAAEPVAVKSKPARSGDTLDDLMADAASGTPSKDRRNTSRSIDAMLQDVQKSRPAPRPARAEPESLPSLTASDIARAMAGVKTGARACGKRFEQSGVADLKLTVGKDGRVTDVAVRGKLANAPISDCIAQAARGASFPPNSGLKFDYRIDVQ